VEKLRHLDPELAVIILTGVSSMIMMFVGCARTVSQSSTSPYSWLNCIRSSPKYCAGSTRGGRIVDAIVIHCLVRRLDFRGPTNGMGSAVCRGRAGPAWQAISAGSLKSVIPHIAAMAASHCISQSALLRLDPPRSRSPANPAFGANTPLAVRATASSS